MSNFYDVYCINCGNKTSADKMAIDVDAIIIKHLEIATEKENNNLLMSLLAVLNDIKIGFYMTNFDLGKYHFLNETSLILNGKNILLFLENRYDIHFTFEKEEKTTEVAVNKKDIIFSDPDDFSLNEKQKNMGTFKFANSNIEVVNRLSELLAVNKAKDVKEEQKKEIIYQLLDLLYQLQDTELANCKFQYIISEDDKKNEFISSLNVTYKSGEKVSYKQMVCPLCGEKYYIEAGKYIEHIIIMLGSSRTGKTAYLAALIDNLNPKYGKNSIKNINVLDSIENPQYDTFEELVLNRYRQGMRPIKTPAVDIMPIFSLEFVINGKTAIFMFLDMPGEIYVPSKGNEELANNSHIINKRKICQYASAYWFCIDPTQIDKRQEINNANNDEDDKVELDMRLVLSNIRNSILQMNRQTKVPTAVMITKMDLIHSKETTRDIFHPGSGREALPCLRENLYFNVNEFQGVAKEVINYLQDDNVKDILKSIDSMFELYNYFAVAAYGIVANDNVSTTKPYGVVLPFTWTLAMLGYLTPMKSYFKSTKKNLFNKNEDVTEIKSIVSVNELISKKNEVE